MPLSKKMTMPNSLFINTPLGVALEDLLKQLATSIRSPHRKLTPTVYIAGGMAVHLYTGVRVTSDVDMEIDVRAIVPPEMIATAYLEDGTFTTLSFDNNFFMAITLMHEDYRENALSLSLNIPELEVKVLSPVDLVISKLSRFADNDQQDIVALAKAGLINPSELAAKARDAISGYVGNLRFIEMNLNDAIEMINDICEINHNNYKP